jgi:Rod binding domain-containing protein
MAGLSSIALPAPGVNAMDLLKNNAPAAAKFKSAAGAGFSDAAKAKAKAAAQDFEGVFLNSMFQQMFAGVEGDGPMGGKGSTGVWRSFLTDEYAKGFAKSGGIGIADQVYGALLAQQEARS